MDSDSDAPAIGGSESKSPRSPKGRPQAELLDSNDDESEDKYEDTDSSTKESSEASDEQSVHSDSSLEEDTDQE